MLKILQARLQQYVNRELSDVQAGFRKGRGTRHQTANICWIIKKAREFQKNIYLSFTVLTVTFRSMIHFNVFVHGVREGSNFVLLHVNIQLFTYCWP